MELFPELHVAGVPDPSMRHQYTAHQQSSSKDGETLASTSAIYSERLRQEAGGFGSERLMDQLISLDASVDPLKQHDHATCKTQNNQTLNKHNHKKL